MFFFQFWHLHCVVRDVALKTEKLPDSFIFQTSQSKYMYMQIQKF